MTSRKRSLVWAWVVIVTNLFYFALPLIAMIRFAFQRIPVALLGRKNILDRWTLDGLVEMLRDTEFLPALWLSLRLAILTVVLVMVVMLPTTIWVNTRGQRYRSLVEVASMLPYVVPPIALVVGAGGAFRDFAPWFLRSDYSLVPFYAILAMPFTFRAMDTGLRAIDLATLLEAARSLGASGPQAIIRIVIPNITTALSGAAFLTVTVVLGEFTIASLLLKPTLPLYLSYSQGSNPQGALGLAVLLLLLTSVLFFLASRNHRRGKQTDASTMGVLP